MKRTVLKLLGLAALSGCASARGESRSVSVDEYNAYLKGLAAEGQTGEIKAPAWPNAVPSAPADEEHP